MTAAVARWCDGLMDWLWNLGRPKRLGPCLCGSGGPYEFECVCWDRWLRRETIDPIRFD